MPAGTCSCSYGMKERSARRVATALIPNIRRSARQAWFVLVNRTAEPPPWKTWYRSKTLSCVVVSFRFSQWKEVDYEARIAPTWQDLQVMLAELRASGVDIFHSSARRFWIPEWPNSDLGIAGWTKSLTDAPVIAVGSVGLDTDVMENFFGKEAQSTGEAGLSELLRRFNNAEFDLVAVGRGHIGDPDWVKKVAQGQFSGIRLFTKKDLLGDLEIEGSFVEEAHRSGD